MQVVILAGGYGTRLAEETSVRPKPMVEIGGKPILWHVMKIYSHYGFNDFIILLGYKGYYIKEYFTNYFVHQSNIRINLATNEMTTLDSSSEPWTVTLLDTGPDTMTGGRIKRAQRCIGDEPFLLTYGDGVSDVDVNQTIAHHRRQGKLLTMTAIQPEARFGNLSFDADGRVDSFREKARSEAGWVNGGFFVCEPGLFDYLDDDEHCILEKGPMQRLVNDGQLVSYQHNGFWHSMDTLRDNTKLNGMWKQGDAPWKLWDD